MELAKISWELFAQHYARHGVGTRAAVHAGLAKATAYDLLTQPAVGARISEIRKQLFGSLHMSADEVLGQIARVARSDIRNIYDPQTGQLLPPWELDDDTAACISEIEVRETEQGEQVKKYKMASKLDALKTLAQHHKLIGGDVQINITADLGDRLERARKRVTVGVPGQPELTNEGHPPVLLHGHGCPSSNLVLENISEKNCDLVLENISEKNCDLVLENCGELPGDQETEDLI